MLYLTYDTTVCCDGLGAQYQRVVGIIALAIEYNCIYVHTPLDKIEFVHSKEYLAEIEKYFQIKNNYTNVDQIKFDKVISIICPKEEDILSNFNNPGNTLIKICVPYDILDKNTKLYYKAIDFLKIIKEKKEIFNEDNIIKIAIHIRRGDVSFDKNTSRYIPIDYYIKIINSLKKKYKNSKIYILTEINENNLNEFKIFKNYKNVIVFPNLDTLYTLEFLIKADVLVISKSSFSYLAGLYNNNIVYYIDFWHPPLIEWNNIKELEIQTTYYEFFLELAHKVYNFFKSFYW